MACICALDRPCAFRTTASGLPLNRSAVNTSTVANCNCIGKDHQDVAKRFRPAFRCELQRAIHHCRIAYDRALRQQMNRDFERIAARAAPAIFVVLWSTGFVGPKYVLADAEPLTYLASRMVVVVTLMALVVAIW